MTKLTTALLIASLAAWHPARAATYDEIYQQQRMENLRDQQQADENRYQLDQMRQQTRDQQRDFDAYQEHQDSLNRHYRSLYDPE